MYGEPVNHTGATTALVSKQSGWTFFCLERERSNEPTRLLWVEARAGQICLVDREKRVRFSFAACRKGPTGTPEWIYVEAIRPDEPGPDESFSGGRQRGFTGTARVNAQDSRTFPFAVQPLALLRAAHAQQESVEV